MKRNKLVADVSFDFFLIGIIAPIKEYQLAWNLNQINDLHFVKGDNIIIEFNDLSRILISNYVCQSERHSYTLLKNKLVSGSAQKNQMLLSELSQFDYFIKFQSQIDDFNINEIFTSIKELKAVDFVVRLDIEKIRQKENLLY